MHHSVECQAKQADSPAIAMLEMQLQLVSEDLANLKRFAATDTVAIQGTDVAARYRPLAAVDQCSITHVYQCVYEALYGWVYCFDAMVLCSLLLQSQ